jgi:hypothetical protein
MNVVSPSIGNRNGVLRRLLCSYERQSAEDAPDAACYAGTAVDGALGEAIRHVMDSLRPLETEERSRRLA